jgi:uncharacterized membrane protein YgcG/uncharacterized membrane protein
MLSRAVLRLLCFVVATSALAALSFPELTGRVVDEAGILDPATKAALERKLADFETKTTGQIVVVVLKSLRGTSIEDYGYQLGRHWQIGQKDKNTGALLIVAPNERKVRIEVGYGFEGTLTDAVSKLIIENSIIPRLRANDYAGGIGRGVDDIIQAVSVDPEEWRARARARPDGEPGLVDLLAPLLLFFIIMVIFSSAARDDRRYAQPGRTPRQGGRGPIFIPIPGSWGGGSSWPDSGGGFSGGGGSFGGGGASGSYLLGRLSGIVSPAPSRPAGEAIISDFDKGRIVSAIRAAEERTAAQILCVIARACGGYRLIPIAWAAIVSFAVPLALIYLTAWPAAVIYVIQLAVFIATALVLSIPTIRLRIVPRQRIWRRVRTEAIRQFFAQGVDNTTQRCGLLIFASVAEDHAEIVADRGVDAKVKPEAWAGAIATLVTAIKADQLADGFVAAIELCGRELAANVPPGELTSHESSDRVIEI